MLTIKNYKKLKGQYLMTHSMTESWKVLDVRETKSAYEIIIRSQVPYNIKNGTELTMKIGRERPDGASEYEYMITSIDIVIGVLNRCIIRIENIDTMDSMIWELKTIIEM
jgi:neutral trehalase